jgi:hypothetical protein
VSVTISTPFSITSTGPNSIDFPETSRDVVSAAYAISVNATIPFTYVLVKDVIIAFSEDLADSSANGINLKNEANVSFIASTSGFSDPCRFPVPTNETVVMHYNATTDTPDGRISTTIGFVDVPQIRSGDEIDISCPRFGPCTRFLYLDIDAPAEEYILNFTVTRVRGDRPTLTFAGGPDTCPTAWSSNKGVRVQQKLDDDSTFVVNAQVSKTTRFWIQYSVPTLPTTDKATLKFSWSTSKVPETPVTSPTAIVDDGFPKWAIAVIVVGGLLIVGGIIFVAVKFSRKSSKGYTDI